MFANWEADVSRVVRWGVFGIVTALLVATAGFAGAQEQPKVGEGHKKVCKPGGPGVAACHADIATKDKQGTQPLASATYTSGLNPSDLKSAYKLPATPVSG